MSDVCSSIALSMTAYDRRWRWRWQWQEIGLSVAAALLLLSVVLLFFAWCVDRLLYLQTAVRAERAGYRAVGQREAGQRE
jgi:hypothetical protein